MDRADPDWKPLTGRNPCVFSHSRKHAIEKALNKNLNRGWGEKGTNSHRPMVISFIILLFTRASSVGVLRKRNPKKTNALVFTELLL